MQHFIRITTGFCLALVVVSPALAQSTAARQAMVATVHPLATDAALAAIRKGGNALDGAVAAALTLGVCDPQHSGLGGGCFILLRRGDGSLAAIDGRETAPRRANPRMYLRDGKPQTALSQTGPLASGVPGALAAYAMAIEQYGRLKLPELLLPAATIAESGFPVDRVLAASLQEKAADLARFSGSRDVLLKSDGSPYGEGETLRQPDLAKTYRAIARHGPSWFYRGEFAACVGRWMAEHDGILTADDFAAYRPCQRQPLVTTYRDWLVVGFPPPSSGGVHVAEILNILERFDVKSIFQNNPAQFDHLLAEAMKRAFADRAYWLGDADFVAVPRGLVDKRYATGLARGIDLQQVTPVAGHGTPPRWQTDRFGRHTTHIAVADADGNWVGITATINTLFGSKVIVPGTGVVLNNEMDDFSIAPGTPNAFGLVGAEANAIAPGKRPLSSMSPTIVLRRPQDDRGAVAQPPAPETVKRSQPALTVGAAGGPMIITQVVGAIVRRLDLGMDLDAALATPRLHHQWSPNILVVDRKVNADRVTALEQYGHVVQRRQHMATVQAIAADGQTLVGAHDPDVPGKAAGW